MKKLIKSESGAASILEATILFPIVLVTVMFLIFVGFTFLQRAILQSTADRLSQYLSRCVAYPGYTELIDPFYEPAKDTSWENRVKNAMADEYSDPYRYTFGIFGLYSKTKEYAQTGRDAMLKNGYLEKVSFLKPSTTEVGIPAELASLSPETENGYVCGISASTSNITVYLGQKYIFAGFYDVIGIGNAEMMIYGKSTSNVTDVPETVRLVDWSFDTVEKLVCNMGDGKGAEIVEKVKEAIKKISGNG